jgi:serine/threonine-protein kinase
MAEIKIESLGKYKIIEEIGHGRFGVVFRAEHPFLKKTVAIKLFTPALFGSSDLIQRFIQEVRAVAGLKQDNITKIIDLADDQGRLIVVMDFVQGGDVHTWLKKQGRASFRQSKKLIADVAAALDFAHHQGLVHGDVKPGNILIAEDGSAKLSDFSVLGALIASGAVAPGAALGSPAYLSPEQVNGASPTPRSDQYALGVVAFELLTGRRPFEGDTPLSISMKQVNEAPPLASQINPLVPPKLEAVLQRVLSKDPEKRFPDCSSFAQAVLEAESSTEAQQYQDLIARATAALEVGDGDTALPLVEYALQLMPDRADARELLEDLKIRDQVQHSYKQASDAIEKARTAAQLLRDELDDPADPQGVLSVLAPLPSPAWQVLLYQWRVGLYLAGGIVLLGLLLGLSGVLYFSLSPANNLPKARLVELVRTSTPLPPTETARPTDTPTLTLEPTFTPTATIPPTSTPVPTLGAGSTKIRSSDAMLMVFIPAGEFTMGSDKRPDEQPIHTVNLNGYWIDQTEVTNRMYERCVQSAGCVPKTGITSFSRNKYYTDSRYQTFPVVQVDWNQAKAYCKWAGVRLPTEAEWEKAARGIGAFTYPWGEGIDSTLANYGRIAGDTTEVGIYPTGKSPYGLYDMSGNVWEWVSSLYQKYPYNPEDGREDLTKNLARVVRGGSWYDDEGSLTATFRYKLMASNPGDKIGFRCAADGNP